jgi:PadR family transcriptional regulator AphA
MSLKYALLGLINYQPMSGYDLKTIFDHSINYFWTASTSQIYRDLAKLEGEGYMTSRLEPQRGRPDKRIYTITDAGRKAFVVWLNLFPSTLRCPIRYDFLVRVFFGSQIQSEDLLYQLRRFIKEKQKELEDFHELNGQVQENTTHEDSFYWKLTMKLGVMSIRTEIQWAEECLNEYEEFLKAEIAGELEGGSNDECD